MTDFIAMGDQAVEEVKPLARAAASFYLELVKIGVPDGYAVMMTQSWIAALTAKLGGSNDSGET